MSTIYAILAIRETSDKSSFTSACIVPNLLSGNAKADLKESSRRRRTMAAAQSRSGGVRCVSRSGAETETVTHVAPGIDSPYGQRVTMGYGKSAVNDAKTDRQLRLYVGLVAFAGLCCLIWAVGHFPAMTPAALLYPVALTIIIASAYCRHP